MRGLFVTGTDTGVGKTILSAALLAAIAAEGEPVWAHKPAVTGLQELSHNGTQPRWPPDHELLASVAGMSAEEVAPLRYGPAVSPHFAAQLAEEVLDPKRMVAAAAVAACNGRGPDRTVIVEGVGGLQTPLAENFTICDFAEALRLPVLIAARPGLGTINHTLLTLQSARASGLSVRAVVLTPWPQEPSALELSNRREITRLGFVEVDVLGEAHSAEPEELARVGSELPWRRWLGMPSGVPLGGR
jgi:dethiobiotin synthetase